MATEERSRGSSQTVSFQCIDQKPQLNKYTFTCAILSSMPSILVGLYSGNSISEAWSLLMEDLKLVPGKLLVFSLIFAILCPIASLAAGTTSDWIGRRYTLLFSLVAFFLGSLFTSLAPNAVLFFSGCVLVTIAVGYARTVIPVYITELSPESTRGFLACFVNVFENTGVLLGNVLAYAWSQLTLRQLRWRLALVGTIPSFLLALALIFPLPESPSWLVTRQRLSDAERVLVKTSKSEEEGALRLVSLKSEWGIVEHALNDGVSSVKGRSRFDAWREILLRPSPSVRKALIAVVGLNFFRHSTGVDALDLYQPMIISMGKVKNQTDILLLTTAIGLAKICIILLAGFLMDRVGRRPLLLTSVLGILPCLAGLGLGLTVYDHRNDRLIRTVPLCWTMALLYEAFYSIGLGPVIPLYSSEIFQPSLRAPGASIGSSVNWSTSGIVSITFISAVSRIRIGGTFLMFAGVASIACLYIYKLVPETLDKSSELGTERPKSKSENHVAQSQRSADTTVELIGNDMHILKLYRSATFPTCGRLISLKGYTNL